MQVGEVEGPMRSGASLNAGYWATALPHHSLGPATCSRPPAAGEAGSAIGRAPVTPKTKAFCECVCRSGLELGAGGGKNQDAKPFAAEKG
jgi:hypothetical protein